MNTDTNIVLPLAENELKLIFDSAVSAVKKAGSFLSESKEIQIEQKEGHANFVTDMDVRTQELLVNELAPLIPDASFLLEESDEEIVFSDFVWIIDPIDGTTNFIYGLGQSCISVGLYYRKKGIAGIVYNPFSDELFTAIIGKGAYMNGSPIGCAEHSFDTSIIFTGSAPYYDELRKSNIKVWSEVISRCGDFRRFGSAALEICYVACGRADGFFELRLCPWDFSAAAVILKEAGGRIIMLNNNNENPYEKTGIVAASSATFDTLYSIVAGK